MSQSYVNTRSDEGPRLFRRRLFLLNLCALVACVAAGRLLYAGAFGYADVLNMYNPYPQLDAAGASTATAHGFGEYVAQWYRGLNGRWGVAVVNAAIELWSKAVVHRPEQFPWWLMRSLSLFCIVTTPLNFIAAGGQLKRGSFVAAALLLGAWGIWSSSPNTFGYSVWFDALLADRFIPMYVASLLAVALALGPRRGHPAARLAFGAGYVFIAVEQFLVTLPIILAAYAFAGTSGRTVRRGLETFAACVALSALSGWVYVSSPGQRWRNTLLNLSAPDLSPRGLLHWFTESTPLGYRVLFGGTYGRRYVALHLALFATLALAGAILARRAELRPVAAEADVADEGSLRGRAWILAVAFCAAYSASLATLLVSPHFPEYAAQYPALLLTLAWVCTAASVIPLRPSALSAAAITTAMAVLVVALTVPALRTDVTGFREETAFGVLRKRTYARILEINADTGATGFVVTNSPLRSIGGNMEPPWGLSAYFRWIGRSDLAVYIDTNYDYPSRPRDRAYVTIDLGGRLQP
jgi:hypothetical protein